MGNDETNAGSLSENPWVNSDGNFAHPNSPAGQGGPGQFKDGRPWGCTVDHEYLVPHAQSPAARTFAAKSAEMNAIVARAAMEKKLTVKGVIVGGGPLDEPTIDSVNMAAQTATNKRYIAYETVVKVGGSIAWRANNPGNLRRAPTKIGTVPGAVGEFAVFATMEDGRTAQRALYLRTYGAMTVRDAVPKLTPPEDQNDTPAYLEKLEKAGIDLDKDMKSQIDELMSAIEKNEGMKRGTEVPRNVVVPPLLKP